ncbi:hypothetical protein GS966_25585 [Rhodococcus hoagii]|nr:hypothetical protein [Prescottella equi]NKS61620.1 hypothetical protein [Prescottella equi]NKZ93275.1 hypothetical protein [Prescottella equi]
MYSDFDSQSNSMPTRSWLITDGDAERAPYPSTLITHDVDDAETARMLATHDPFVYARDRRSSIVQLLDWILRTAPARTLDLYGQPDPARALLELPEIDSYKAPGPSLLRKYVTVLETGMEALEADRCERDPDGSSALSPHVHLPRLVDEICQDASVLLAHTRIRAVARARHLIWFGLWQADAIPGLSAETYAHEVDMNLRTAIFERVDGALWVPTSDQDVPAGP